MMMTRRKRLRDGEMWILEISNAVTGSEVQVMEDDSSALKKPSGKET